MGTLLLLASMNRTCSLVAVRFLLPFVLPFSLCLDLDNLDLFEWSETDDFDFLDFLDLVTDIDERSPDKVEFYLWWALARQLDSLR